MFNMAIKYGTNDSNWNHEKSNHEHAVALNKLKTKDYDIKQAIAWVRRHYIQGDDVRMDQEEAWGVLTAIEDYLEHQENPLNDIVAEAIYVNNIDRDHIGVRIKKGYKIKSITKTMYGFLIGLKTKEDIVEEMFESMSPEDQQDAINTGMRKDLPF